MNELRGSEYDALSFEPNEGQHSLSRSSGASLCCPSLGSTTPLSQETLDSLDSLGTVLRRIRKRMIVEGYEIRNGKVRQI